MHDLESSLEWEIATGRLPYMALPPLERLGAVEWALAVAKLDGIPTPRRMKILVEAMKVNLAGLKALVR